MSVVRQMWHLTQRWWGSLSTRPPAGDDLEWALGQLLPGERELWLRMEFADQRHSIEVARRFVRVADHPTRDQIAGALLHDVGKIESGLGTTMRVVATLVGPRTERFRRYHHHETLGLALAESAGSSPDTLELLRWRGPAVRALRLADDYHRVSRPRG